MRERDVSATSIPDPHEFEPEDDDLDPRMARRAAFSGALASAGFSNTLVLSRERAAAVFHDRRLEIIEYLSEHEPATVRGLAAALGHDKGVVSRDLKALARLDVVEYVSDGRAKAPRLKHDHVVVEPVI